MLDKPLFDDLKNARAAQTIPGLALNDLSEGFQNRRGPQSSLRRRYWCEKRSFGGVIPAQFLGPELRGAMAFCWTLFVICVALNVVPFVLAVTGLEHIGALKLSLGSAGSAALEVREDLER
jgi:hypothetical protein